MKLSERILTLFVVFCLVLLYLGLSRTTYNSIDISETLKKVKSELNSNQELIVFKSKNPFNFKDIIKNLDIVSDQDVYGIITYPEVNKAKYPAIIGVAGSLGWGEHHLDYLRRYREIGIATVELHSFKSRDVSSTVGEQVSATIPMIVHDAYMLLSVLANNPKIKKERIGITGWSLGGGVALFSGWKKIKDLISPDYQFAAHLPVYPPCITNVDDLDFVKNPIYILIGELDNWVPAEPCVEFIENLKFKGHNNASITVFPNSHHSYDRKSDLKVVESGYSLTDCRLVLEPDGTVKTKDYSFPLSNSFMQKLGLYLCADKGPTMGGNKEARMKSKDYAVDFFTTHLISE
tara:strand:+ start:898 stop:1941 length:1044 start_codon:yes stop_codon:yes gene_type:complete